jgi:1-acyl-sn-glycerol-3-phosphate acyltransferase
MGTLRYLPRTLLTLLTGVVATLIAALVVIVVARINPTSPWIEKTAHGWSRAWLAAAGVELEVTGSEGIERDRSYVVVANHVSILDIMVSFLAVPIPIRFLAKKELFRIPILASAMRAIGIVEVDRGARGAIHDRINTRARDLVASKRSLIIYPEGTRSRQGGLGPFKKGAFTIAVGSQLPVLPVSIRGSYEAWPPGSPWVRGGKIVVAVDPPIETLGMSQSDTAQLRDTVHGIIEKRLAELSSR